MPNKIKPIAIYLPQFHPIPENDQWWGKGFTEWTNVVKAKPRFEGHYQPHLPADLGFYDLRLQEARLAQEQLAKAYGIHGFCYYHYWFNGKRMLYEPLDRKLKDPKEDLPFMMCWANENWTRTWDGLDKQVLMEQSYSTQDDIDHLKYLIPFFKDSRYIKVNEKPVFIVYKPFLFPNVTETVKRWRELAAENGLELYLCHAVFSYHKGWDTLLEGFDAAIDFEPFGIRRQSVFNEIERMNQSDSKVSLSKRIVKKIKRNLGYKDESLKPALNKLDYEFMISNIKSLKEFSFKMFPNIVAGWDNSARRKNNPTLILDNATPELFEKWLTELVTDFIPYSEDENFIFINAWNEWAEGNYLEPSQKWGTAYLEKVKKVFDKY
ncbi:glycoside hydrolase family 99-like domain-containing protein [Flavobacterium sp. LT1R49]|uniref:glycosyltransferase WbsX family protein n=1 Tax=Flavobacterium arabinosi TaxID=3398737 RepID=UPI003A850F0F